jgi:hypothetical protein
MSSATNWYRYTARQFDSDTALYYYRALVIPRHTELMFIHVAQLILRRSEGLVSGLLKPVGIFFKNSRIAREGRIPNRPAPVKSACSIRSPRHVFALEQRIGRFPVQFLCCADSYTTIYAPGPYVRFDAPLSHRIQDLPSSRRPHRSNWSQL